MTKRVELSGLKFNKWTVGKYLYNHQNHSFYECICDCGTVKPVSGNYLRKGSSKSCGCHNKEVIEIKKAISRQNHRKSLANVHNGMMIRCYKVNFHSYKDYGARGIKVCQEWHIQKNFREWALKNGYKPGLQLDRIDNNGSYEPLNCRFVSRKQNMNKTRKSRFFPWRGRLCTVSEIADELGKSYEFVRNRLRRGHILENEVQHESNRAR